MTQFSRKQASLTGARGQILFDRGRAVPRSDFGLFLSLVGEKLAREPHSSVQVVGHANLRESPRSATLLGMKRANGIASVLVAFGADINQLHVSSAGARVPTLTPTGRADPAVNRRVELYWGPSPPR